MLAEPSSISESNPKPSSATEPAISAKMIATPASIVIQPILSQDSAFARRTSRTRSALAGKATGDETAVVMSKP